MIDTKNSSIVYVVMHKLITQSFFGLEQEDGSLNYCHTAGTSPPPHFKQVEE